MKRGIVVLIILALAAIVIYIIQQANGRSEFKASLNVSEAMSGGDTSGYSRALKPVKFNFPEDHGPHHGFKTEWWYFTGNLETAEGRHFGYQFTLFRYSLSNKPVERASTWGASQIFMGHYTVTDAKENNFYSFERFSRQADKMAGATAKPFKVWLEDWSVTGMNSLPFPPMHISASEEGISAELELKSIKPMIPQGNNGLSQKGPEPGNASYYYSLTRMETEGIIKIGKMEYKVKGFSWMDREWSTSALGREQAGWDWFSLQLDNGIDIMYYILRKKDGSPDVYSRGKVIHPGGYFYDINPNNINIEVTDHWESAFGGVYPSGWEIIIPSEKLTLEVKPYVPDQELNHSIRYWEGAVKIKGMSGATPVEGSGYIELTGYAPIGVAAQE